ncbi:aldolase/citrate lyase family protein [Candidatus Latescibacterota bacterium]
MSFKRFVTLMAVCTMLMVLVAPSVFAQRAAQPPPAPAGTVTFNTVFTKLAAGEPVFCQSVSTPDTARVREFCQAERKPDYIWIGNQHRGMDWETIQQMIMICNEYGIPPFVRIPQTFTPTDCQHAADSGALGIVVPMVETIEQAQKAVMYFRNPIMDEDNPSVQPWGKRSQGGSRIWGPDYQSNWNNNCFIMFHDESTTGVANLEYILQYVPGINGVMIASSDFGYQVGDRDGDPTYEAREEIARKAVLAHGLTLIGPSRWYGDPRRPGYMMFQGMGPDSVYEH